jgi:pentafunctional AROM polypeptide
MLHAISQLTSTSPVFHDNGDLQLHGCNGKLSLPSLQRTIHLRGAGTAVRFMVAIIAATHRRDNCDSGNDSMGIGRDNDVIILDGSARMRERPIGDLVDSLISNGAHIEYMNKHGCLPLRIHRSNGLHGGDIVVAANISSQFVSALLLW